MAQQQSMLNALDAMHLDSFYICLPRIPSEVENPISRKYELGKGIIILKASLFNFGYSFGI